MNPTQPQKLDQDIVNLSKAIRQVESGNQAVLPQEGEGFGGKSRYQYSNDTWKEVAGKYLGNPNAELNLQNENQATYKRLEDWKKQGYNPGQIASMWNAGPGEPNAYLGTFSNGKPAKGVNEYNVEYDVPGHATKVRDAYQQIKTGGAYAPPPEAPKPFAPATQTGVEGLSDQLGMDAEGGFVSDLGDAFRTGADKGSEAMQRGFKGESDPFSAGYQTAGAAAGVVGDTFDAALSNAPVIGPLYEGATDLIGGAVQGAMGTEAGQKGKEAFDKLSPDTQRNIGATADILSVFPLFKSLKFGKKGLKDAATGMTQSKVIRQATDEIEGSLSKGTGRGLERAKDRGLDPVKTILDDPNYIPEIIDANGKYIYDTKQGAEAMQRAIDADEMALQSLFDKTVPGQAAGISLDSVIARTLSDLKKPGKLNTNIDAMERYLTKFFDNTRASLGRDYINLTDLNDLKRAARKPINYGANDPFNAVSKEIAGDLSSSLMKQVEEAAKKAGVEGVESINKSMGGKLTALDILEDLGGKAIKSGSTGKQGLIKSVASTIPGVEGIVDYATRGVPSTATKRLRDKRPLPETARKGVSQGVKGLALSALTGA